jgi:hypothetical protein
MPESETNFTRSVEEIKRDPREFPNEIRNWILSYLDIDDLKRYRRVNTEAKGYVENYLYGRTTRKLFARYPDHTTPILNIPFDRLKEFTVPNLPPPVLKAFEDWAGPRYQLAFKELFDKPNDKSLAKDLGLAPIPSHSSISLQYLNAFELAKAPACVVKIFFNNVNPMQVPDRQHRYGFLELFVDMTKKYQASEMLVPEVLTQDRGLDHQDYRVLWNKFISNSSRELQKQLYAKRIPHRVRDSQALFILEALITHGHLGFLKKVLNELDVTGRIPNPLDRLNLIQQIVARMQDQRMFSELVETYYGSLSLYSEDVPLLEEILDRTLAEQKTLNQERTNFASSHAHNTPLWEQLETREQAYSKIAGDIAEQVRSIEDQFTLPSWKSHPYYLEPDVKYGRERAKELPFKILDNVKLFLNSESRLTLLKQVAESGNAKIRKRMTDQNRSDLLNAAHQKELKEFIKQFPTRSEELLTEWRDKAAEAKRGIRIPSFGRR